MFSLRAAAIALPLHLVMAFPTMAADPVTLDTEAKNLSYALGVFYGDRLLQATGNLDFELDSDAMIAAITDSYGDGETQITNADAVAMLEAHAKKAAAEASAGKLAENAAFLAENGAKDGIVTTESGLQYKVVAEGEGESPTFSDTVSVHYEGRLLNGTVFDSSIARGEPAEFPVGGVIPGWIEALQLMKPGGKFEVWIPSSLAYAERGAGQDIGPNEVLNFDMELLSIVSK